jgi:hypothetical protein
MADTGATSPDPQRSSRSHTLAETTRRALAMWPRLDRKALTRCAGEPSCIAAYVSRRTKLPVEIIRAILGSAETDAHREIWFG